MATQNEENLERNVAVRGEHRGVLTRLIKEAEQNLLEVPNSEEGIDRLQTLSEAIEAKGKVLESLDEKVLSKIKTDDIEREVNESSSYAEKIIEVRRKINNLLKKIVNKTSPWEKTPELSQSVENTEPQSNASDVTVQVADIVDETNAQTSNTSTQATGTNTSHVTTNEQADISFNESVEATTTEVHKTPVKLAKPKLPKLCLPKFKGNVKKWHAFWELFESLIHKNSEMSPIDKFNYLSTLLEDEESRVIQGLPLTNANYNVAIEILKDRFGKPQTIVTAHMDDLLKLPSLGSNCRVKDLRAVLDQLTIHVRGLETLGISAQQYGSLLTPIVMSKLPSDIRLLVARKTNGSLLELNSIIELLKVEVEAREASFSLKTHDVENRKPWERNRVTGGKNNVTGAFLNNSNSQTGNIICVFCSKPHFSASCEEVKDIGKRREIIVRDRRCFLCLKRGHRASECNRSVQCRKCKKRHHQSICNVNKTPEDHSLPKNERPLESQQGNPESSNNTNHNENARTLSATNFTERSSVVLQTATAMARGTSNSMAVPVRILFDGGSQRSYITKDLRDRLGLSPKRVETLNLSTFGDKVYRKQRCELVELELFKGDGDSLNISALTFPQICSALPSKVDLTDCPAFESLDLASDASCDNKPIDILIGSDLYWEFVSGKVIRSNTGLVAIESKFGWILSGTTEGPNVDTDGVSVSHLIVTRDVGVCQPRDDLKLNLQRFWETESIGILKEPEKKSIKDEEELFQLNIERENGRYSVNLPWKTDGQPLPTHYELSKTRLTYLQQRLQKNKELMKKYDDIIEEQLQAGIVEPVSTENENRINNPKIHYLPHHAVVREDKTTTKVRKVFNGSAKLDSGDLSINECLERGPNLVPSLFDILVRFRSHPYALVADIEKAFHMISIKEEDRDSLRFLWLKSVEDGLSEVVVYRFCRLVFGLKPSPAILGATIKHHLSKYSTSEPKTTKVLENDLYVDDLATGTESEDNTIRLYNSAKEVMNKGGFNPRKWNSNSSRVRKYIANCENDGVQANHAEEERLSDELNNESLHVALTEDDPSYAKVCFNPLSSNEKCEVKVLGLTWNYVHDTFKYSIQDLVILARQLPLTKRSVLKMSARVFDPLGLITPFSINLKILFQELCSEATDWDVELSNPFKNKWEKLILQLPALDDIEVTRNCFPASDNGQVVELHGFSDASTKAYAAAIYVRVVEEDVISYNASLCEVSCCACQNTNHSPLGAIGSSSSGSFDGFSNKGFFGQCFSRQRILLDRLDYCCMLDSKSTSLEAICYATCRRDS